MVISGILIGLLLRRLSAIKILRLIFFGGGRNVIVLVGRGAECGGSRRLISPFVIFHQHNEGVEEIRDN
jgi:hypothetical protein